MQKLLLIPLTFMVFPSLSMAQSYDNLAQIEVLTGWRTDAGTHMAAIEINLAPGWITYWRAPGDAGIPPQFTFSSPDGVQSITPHWPTPQVIGDDGMRSIGYYDSVIFPLTVDVGDTKGPVSISGEILIGVCEEICIPVTMKFDTLLPASGGSDAAIDAALAAQPRSQSQAGVGDVICAVDPINDGLRLTATVDVARTAPSEHVVIEASDPRIWVSEAVSTRDGDTLSATVDMIHPSGEPFALDRSGVRVTILGAERGVDIRGCGAG